MLFRSNTEIFEGFDPDLLYSLVRTSNHPISQGIAAYLEASCETLRELPLEKIKSIEAKGIQALYQGSVLRGGNLMFMQNAQIKAAYESKHSLFFFAINDMLVAQFELSDTIRENAAKAIEQIKTMGIKVVMLTGDHEQSARHVAKAVGIDEVYAKLLPTDKANLIDQFHEQGHIVVMAGDGINDTLALSKADIAIAMGNGADIAIGVSDVVLMDEKPQSIYEAYAISRRTFKAVKENLAFSLLYNTVAVPLAVIGFVNPLVAALSMSLSSLVVVGNALRMKTMKLKGF